MIKFFRHIRKKLISENNMGKYFKYAIGEILLVVIGILIALQINNWNEERKEKHKAKSYLINIKEDLALDTIQLSRAIVHIEASMVNTTKLLSLRSFENYEIDSLDKLIPRNFYQYSINSQTFDKLINSGVTELSNYNDVFELINVYYTQQKNLFQAVRDWDVEETNEDNDLIFGSSSYEISYNNNNPDQSFFVQTPQESHEALTNILLSVKTRNRIRSALFRKKRLASTFSETIAESKKIITTINKNLID